MLLPHHQVAQTWQNPGVNINLDDLSLTAQFNKPIPLPMNQLPPIINSQQFNQPQVYNQQQQQLPYNQQQQYNIQQQYNQQFNNTQQHCITPQGMLTQQLPQQYLQHSFNSHELNGVFNGFNNNNANNINGDFKGFGGMVPTGFSTWSHTNLYESYYVEFYFKLSIYILSHLNYLNVFA